MERETETIEHVTRSWEIIADKLSKAGWSWGCVSAIDSNGRTIWIADAHRDDGKRYVVHADEKLTAFLQLQSAISAGEFRTCVSQQHRQILSATQSSASSIIRCRSRIAPIGKSVSSRLFAVP